MDDYRDDYTPGNNEEKPKARYASDVSKKFAQTDSRRGKEYATDVISRLTSGVTVGGKLVRDWRDMIPKGSRWNPRDPGDPFCKICEGTGFLRLNLPVGHPYFGKILLCDCVPKGG